MANTKISQLTALTTPTWNEEFVYALNNANGKVTLDTMKTFANTGQQAALVSWTNIKTINGDSILWSWNLVVSWWGWTSITELSADANIWELSEWLYTTNNDLYYTSTGKILPTYTTTSRRQFINVVAWAWAKWYFVYDLSYVNWTSGAWAWFWYSASSSSWVFYRVCDWEYPFSIFNITWDAWVSHMITADWWFSQVVTNAHDTSTLSVEAWKVYSWLTSTIVYKSVYSWMNYTVVADWSTVTNPLNLTLPSASTKPCIITLLCTDDSHAIITWCTMWN